MIILILLTAGYFGRQYYQNQISDLKRDKKSLIIKNDELDSIAEGRYRKLVADTLTIKQLGREVDSLMDIKNEPKVVFKSTFKPNNLDKDITNINNKDSIILIDDYYPTKDDFFINYKAKLNFGSQIYTARWNFSSININGVLSQNSDGTIQADVQLPEYVTLNTLDILSQPQNKSTKKDDFGLLFGASRYWNPQDKGFYGVNAGVRYKKVYILSSFNTNNSIGVNLNYEF